MLNELKHHLKMIDQHKADNEYQNLAIAVIVQAINDYQEPEPRYKNGVLYKTFYKEYYRNHKRKKRIVGVRTPKSHEHRQALDARSRYNEWFDSHSSAEYFLFKDEIIFYIWCEYLFFF